MLGVVIVAYTSADVIGDCLDSVVGAPEIARIVVVDNRSPDATVETVRAWAGRMGPPLAESDPAAPLESRVTLIHAGLNRGFAGAVNIGLDRLKADPEIDAFWILNPDAVARPGTAAALAACAAQNPGFGLMGGRIVYSGRRQAVQADGGRYSRWTGVCESVNQGLSAAEAVAPPAEALDFVTGAHMVASRRFLEEVGPMEERYFLYYEEVDWAMRRGALPIVRCDGAEVVHQGG
ncbi:MAG: glycosyltransferase, partial [Actinomycetota bacterium]